MAFFSRKQAAELAEEITDHLKLIENVKALQTAQKEIATAVAKLGEDVRRLEIGMTALKSDVKYEAMKETQATVFAVQSSFNERLQDISLKVRDIEHATGRIGTQKPNLLSDGNGSDTTNDQIE
ncbi:hypothetical protein [Alteraurantiacibacter aquimixticola]|uniref:Uncharacterized protein n=1 Tax=Alteraurantiacibacter aquimixticola TaxID=2489173 RepID=A0A4T3EWN7_9SPHN|nr:hypothetical protein [Alteraurantiacibacter aquimixticola]TIX48848.1 hypothetical protein E5222_13975 [Alteraurantiacibacter aquimixticola]